MGSGSGSGDVGGPGARGVVMVTEDAFFCGQIYGGLYLPAQTKPKPTKTSGAQAEGGVIGDGWVVSLGRWEQGWGWA